MKEYLNITKGNTSQLQVGLIDNGSAAKPRIQATEQVTLGAGTAKMLTVYDDGVRLGTNADVSNTGKTLFVEGTFGIGPSFANAQITNFGSIANGTFDGGLGNYLPTNSGTNGLLISTPYGTTSGGVVGIGINTTSNNAESFSIFSGTNNSFNKSVATFKADGKVGIGNVNPKEVLHVNGNLTGSGNFEVDGTATIKTLETGGHTDFALVATAAGKVKQMAASPIPLGGIIMWSGTTSSIPTGWKFCDGNGGVSVNGIAIPDLRSKFIYGAGANSSGQFGPGIGDTGGSSTHDHGGNTQSHTLTVSQIPSHDHTYKDTMFSEESANMSETGYIDNIDQITTSSSNRQSKTDANDSGVHSYSMNRTTSPKGGGAAHSHGIDPANHLPPYYALAFIIYVGV